MREIVLLGGDPFSCCVILLLDETCSGVGVTDTEHFMFENLVGVSCPGYQRGDSNLKYGKGLEIQPIKLPIQEILGVHWALGKPMVTSKADMEIDRKVPKGLS